MLISRSYGILTTGLRGFIAGVVTTAHVTSLSVAQDNAKPRRPARGEQKPGGGGGRRGNLDISSRISGLHYLPACLLRAATKVVVATSLWTSFYSIEKNDVELVLYSWVLRPLPSRQPTIQTTIRVLITPSSYILNVIGCSLPVGAGTSFLWPT